MKVKYGIIIVSVFLGILVTIIDSWIDYLFFYEKPFGDILIFDVPTLEIYMRLLILAIFTSFGMIISRMVAKRSQTAEALEKSDERYRTILEIVDEAYFEVDLLGNFTFFNDALSILLGYHPDELMRMGNRDYMPREAAKETFKLFVEAYETGKPIVKHSYEVIKKDGTHRFHELAASLMRDEDGEPVGFRGVAHDITGRRQAEEVLIKSEARFRMLYEDAPLAYQSLDENGHIIEVNQMWLDALGYSRDEVVGKSFGGFLHPDWVGHFEENFPRFKSIGEVLGVEFVMTKKDGSHVLMSINGKVRYDEKGEFVQTHCILHDITEHRQIEEERKKLQNQLQQVHKMEAIGTLSGGIAHDFNNIIGIIMGFTELARHDAPEETPAHGYLSEVLKASNRAKDLVKQILTFSRQGKQDAKPLAIDVIIKETLKMLRASLPTTIEIRQNMEKDAGLIMGDPTQIHQIIMNLATNASHAMGEKGGVLNVGVANVTIDDETAKQSPDLKSGSFVKLTVSDTGHGMEPEVMKRIFDPYYTTKEIGEGTGLGLSVTHGIVESHGGIVNVRSEPGKGTTFEIFFPKIEFDEDQSKISERAPLPTGTERILFVDDEPSMVIIYQSMLERLGYTASVRTSSVEALEAFRAQPDDYDVIITDQTMPHLTGQMLAREIMAIRSDIPIILCSGHSDLINEDKAKEMGISAFAMKPIAMDEMARIIRSVLD